MYALCQAIESFKNKKINNSFNFRGYNEKKELHKDV
jgi:hypothetical protein